MIPPRIFQDSQAFIDLPRIISNLRVTNYNSFGDSLWDFNDPLNERLNSTVGSKCCVPWFQFEQKLPDNVILAIKIVAFAYVHGHQSAGKHYKANTTCSNIKRLLSLFETIYQCSQVTVSSGSVSHINSVFDIDICDIQKGIEKFVFSQLPCKFLLKLFCDKTIIKEISNLTGENRNIKWVISDIDRLESTRKQIDSKRKYRSAIPIPDHLVIKLIVAASSDICWFLRKLEIETFDTYEYFDLKGLSEYDNINLRDAFDDYCRHRERYAEYSLKVGKRWVPERNKHQFYHKHMITLNQFKALSERIQMAARYIILQFTGARYSESISFKNDAVIERKGEFFIRGTVIKGVDERLITNTDHWVAIPIVRDAVKVLQLVNSYTQQNYLFSPNNSAILDSNSMRLSNSGINRQLNNYLYDIDTDREYSAQSPNIMDRNFYVKKEFILSSHRIRNTLANQLFKCRSNLKVIAYHFHHAYLAIKLYKIPNEVTAGYGNINQEILNSATALEKGKMEIIESIYSPDAVLAGGGAAAFIKNKSDFFAGEFAKGNSIESILKNLLKRAIPFADVTLGYCGGKNKVLDENGKEKDPPCIGGMRCNPGRCTNAIIPKVKKIHWERYLDNNLRLYNDSNFFYAKNTLEVHIREAKNVLNILNNGDS